METVGLALRTSPRGSQTRSDPTLTLLEALASSWSPYPTGGGGMYEMIVITTQRKNAHTRTAMPMTRGQLTGSGRTSFLISAAQRTSSSPQRIPILLLLLLFGGLLKGPNAHERVLLRFRLIELVNFGVAFAAGVVMLVHSFALLRISVTFREPFRLRVREVSGRVEIHGLRNVSIVCHQQLPRFSSSPITHLHILAGRCFSPTKPKHCQIGNENSAEYKPYVNPHFLVLLQN